DTIHNQTITVTSRWINTIRY
ncbi:hypothetical protein D041_4078B, partial [Vibrio parahaemolyticus EKP-008]